jgi:hypothetical protein
MHAAGGCCLHFGPWRKRTALEKGAKRRERRWQSGAVSGGSTFSPWWHGRSRVRFERRILANLLPTPLRPERMWDENFGCCG